MATLKAAQEKLHARTSARIERLKKRFFSDKLVVDTTRARIVTRVYQETEGEPIEIRRAKTLERILQEIDIRILPDELVVGCQNASSPRSANVFPEMATYWLERELDELSTRPQDKFHVSDEAKAELRSLFPYWKGRTLHDHMVANMPKDTLEQLELEHPSVFGWCAYQNGVGHIVQNHEMVISKGYRKILEEAEQARQELDLTKFESIKKDIFLRAVTIVCNAVIHFGRRYAAEARRCAQLETDQTRKRELLKIEEICTRVPEHPAGSFHEAVQFLWFIELITQLEVNGVSISPGRFDQYMYPYLEKDLREGTLTEEGALDIIECFWIKLSEMVILYDKITASFITNFVMGEHIILGGQKADGSDATNPLSYLCLQAQMDVGLFQPNISVRYHKGCEDRFLVESLRVVRERNAMPQFLNDELFVPAMVERGVPLEEARCYSADGCDETCIAGKQGGQMFIYLSLAKIFELALNDGKCRICGRQNGPKTGDPRSFASLDDIWRAYKEQLEFAYRHAATALNTEVMVHARVMPVPFLSTTLDTCIERGLDVSNGGVDYYWAVMIAIAGMSNVGDSLAAIQKLVFEEKKVSMTQLLEALDRNFEGHEPLRQMIINKVPKFGNDNDFVDALTVRAVDMSYEESQKYKDPRNRILKSSIWPGYFTVTAHVQFGETVGATPDGRRAGQALNDGISPTQSMDTSGPTAAMNSVAKLHQDQSPGGMIYNMKFSPEILQGDDKLLRLANMIKTYFHKGGGQVQFNVTSTKTLIDAQKKPEKYRNMMVRVVGYSALFVELSTPVQDDLIKRTQYTDMG
jgi:pyruvate formate-lyase/glycerol dehydratase family glycyl radical enzyme